MTANHEIESLVEALRQADETGDSRSFVSHLPPSLQSLGLETQLLAVFHAWKAGQLAKLGEILSQMDFVSPIVLQFLKVHQLRNEGKTSECFSLLRDLSNRCPSPIVQYRFVSEALEFDSLAESRARIRKLQNQLPTSRRLPLLFNYGIACDNSGQKTLAQQICDELDQEGSALARFFTHWLRGALLSHQDSELCVQHYLAALDLIASVPSRETDRSIVAFGALREMFWTGDREGAKRLLRVIQRGAKDQTSSLGREKVALASALTEFLDGRIDRASEQIEALYDQEEWSYSHLQGSFIYLWIQVASRRCDRLRWALPRFTKIRDELAASQDLFDFRIFDIWSRHQGGDLSAEQARRELHGFCQDRSHSALEFHSEWAQGLLALLSPDPFERVKSLIPLRPYPLLQRHFIVLLSQDPTLKHPGQWNFLAREASDELAATMARFRLSLLSFDLGLYLESLKKLHAFGSSRACADLRRGTELIPRGWDEQVLASDYLVDLSQRRILAVADGETLDAQPILAEIFLALYRKTQGLSKEEVIAAAGYTHYSPLQHDPVIYNLITRLREWMKKRASLSRLARGTSGWKLEGREQILCLSSEPELPALDLQLPERQAWIIETLRAQPVLTRAELIRQFAIQKSSAANDFNALISRGLIQRLGSGRGIRYELTKDLS